MTTRQAGYGIQPNSALEGPVRPKAEKKRASHFTEALSSGLQHELKPGITVRAARCRYRKNAPESRGSVQAPNSGC